MATVRASGSVLRDAPTVELGGSPCIERLAS